MLPHVSNLVDIGISKLRIDGRAMNKTELEKVIKSYKLALSGQVVEEDTNITRGHYFRGV